MAQTQHTEHAQRGAGSAPQGNGTEPQAEGTSADQLAWCAAATARKYRVHEGRVFSYGSGMIFELPAPTGFAALNPSVAPMVFQSVAQFVTNRIGQNGDGNVQEKIANILHDGSGTPGAQTNDAFDAAYVDHIEDLITTKLGPHTHKDGVELKGDDLKTAKASRDKLVADSAARDANREKYWTVSIANAVERAKNVPASGKAKRGSAKSSGGGLEL